MKSMKFPCHITPAKQHVGAPKTRRRNQLRADLRLTDPRADKMRIEQAQCGLLKDSYDWIINHAEFQRWRDSPDSRLLWIKGGLGRVRTMFMCGIIDQLAQHSPRVAFSFCQGAHSRPNNVAGVLRGLMYMLLRQQPSLESYIQEDYYDTGRQLFEDADALWGALNLMLGDPKIEGYFIVVDGFHAERAGFNQLARYIAQAVSRHGHLKWVISSSDIPDIEKIFLHMDGHRTMISLKLDKQHVAQAINTYIEHQVSTRTLPEGMATLKILDNNWPVVEAATAGYESVVGLLLEKGADPNEKDGDGLTPLMGAAAEGHTAVLGLLLDKGADLKVVTKDDNFSPLLLAIACGIKLQWSYCSRMAQILRRSA